ncbi:MULTISPECIES: complement resistance protein TraT [Burkholderia]|uniref:complement resistance protein TraT n=1 Tax=Burkholderia TaxID=32008 RepID=UPI001CC687F4|nr:MULTISPECIES: complement resistance protein TraT [Burkholderia]
MCSKKFQSHITLLMQESAAQPWPLNDIQQGDSVTIPCPRCRSIGTEPLNHATRIGGAAGTVAGAAGGVAMTLAGAETGAAIGMLAGPIGSALGGLTGAILAGLIGGTTGCAAGAALGEAVDTHVLDNTRCLHCGHTFSQR